MNTPEVTALSAEELAIVRGFNYVSTGDVNRYWARLLATIAERDERVREAEDKAEKFMQQVRDTCTRAEKVESELAALKSTAVSEDDSSVKYGHGFKSARDVIAHVVTECLCLVDDGADETINKFTPLLEALEKIADYSAGSTIQPVLIARAAVNKIIGAA